MTKKSFEDLLRDLLDAVGSGDYPLHEEIDHDGVVMLIDKSTKDVIWDDGGAFQDTEKEGA